MNFTGSSLFTQTPIETELDSLISSSQKYLNTYPDSTIIFSEKAIHFARQAGNQKYQSKALVLKGMALKRQGHLDEAMKAFRESISQITEAEFPSEIFAGYSQIAFVFIRRQEWDSASVYAKKVHAIAESSNEVPLLFKSYSLLGRLESARGNRGLGLEYYESALDLYKGGSDDPNLITLLNNVAVVYDELGNADAATEYYFRTLKLSVLAKDDVHIALALGNLAVVYEMKGSLDSACLMIREAIRLNKRVGDLDHLLDNYVTLGNIFNRRNQLPQAIHYYEKAVAISDSLDIAEGFAIALVPLGNAWRKSGELKLAGKYLLDGYAWSDSIDNDVLLADAAKGLADLYVQENDFKKAEFYRNKYASLNDSLHSGNLKKLVVSMEVKHRLQAKEGEISLLRADSEIQALRLRTILIVSGALLLIAFLFILSLRQRNRNLRRFQELEKSARESDFRAKMKDLELKALRAQMDPHFIFNCLGSIQNSIELGEYEIAGEYLGKFSRLLRFILETSREPRIPLTRELELLALYLDLENMRFGGSIAYSIDIAPGIDTAKISVPTLLIQPYVENAVKHGLRNKTGPGFIRVQIHMQQDNLCISIEDNGAGRKKASELKREGTGPSHRSLAMELITERLKLTGESTGKKAEVSVVDLHDNEGDASGTRVEIFLPV